MRKPLICKFLTTEARTRRFSFLSPLPLFNIKYYIFLFFAYIFEKNQHGQVEAATLSIYRLHNYHSVKFIFIFVKNFYDYFTFSCYIKCYERSFLYFDYKEKFLTIFFSVPPDSLNDNLRHSSYMCAWNYKTKWISFNALVFHWVDISFILFLFAVFKN